jgi:hypothetical protein
VGRIETVDAMLEYLLARLGGVREGNAWAPVDG